VADPDDPIPFGVSAKTGRPLNALSDESIKALLEREREPGPEAAAHASRTGPGGVAFAVAGGIDANDLTQAGWGVIFGPGTDQKIKDALKPLLDHRKAGGAHPFVVYDGVSGFRSGDTAIKWLTRQGVRLDIVDPDLGVPFYLLIVAPPDSIPFEFQYVLDLYWAAGRVWFDKVEDFRQYADSVVRYETASTVPTTRQLALFAPEHDFDAATQAFNKHVAGPMIAGQGTAGHIGKRQKFKLQPFVGETATKSTLTKIFQGGIEGSQPSVLFSGGHGMAFEPDDDRLEKGQGALVCQDWEGFGEITKDHWFAASDLTDQAKVHGLIHFLFACYGGGCPERDNFDRLNNAPRKIAARPFLARLPQGLLSHQDGGALGVLAHIERAWAYSFQGDRGGSQIQGFRDVIGRLLRGERIGQATDAFNIRWAALSTQLADLHVELQRGADVPLKSLGQLWVARDDARNFMVLGDPAVRLRVEDMPEIA